MPNRGFGHLSAMEMVSVLGGFWTGKYLGCSQQYPGVVVHTEKELRP
jgi:hypothetical protein